MPLMDGREVLDKLSADAAAAVPIIVISGQQPPSGQHDPRIRRWLTKPVTIDELVHEIEQPLVLR